MGDTKEAIRLIGKAQGKIEKSTEAIGDQNESRAINRNTEADAFCADAIAELESEPEPEQPDAPAGVHRGMLLKRNTSGSNPRYPESSFPVIKMKMGDRQAWLDQAAEAGENRVYAYVRALDWPDIFGVDSNGDTTMPTFDYYTGEGTDRILTVNEECIERELALIPVLMDNMETGAWDPHQARIAAGLDAWGDQFPELLFGIEQNVFFGQFTGAGEPDEEIFVGDAMMSSVNGLKTMHAPNAAWGVHYQPTFERDGTSGVWKQRVGGDRVPPAYLDTPGADWYAHQFPWESHLMTEAGIVAEVDKVLAVAPSSMVVVAHEYAQHNEATEDDALRMRGWLIDNRPDVGWGC